VPNTNKKKKNEMKTEEYT